MCLARASIIQYSAIPQKSDHFFNRPNMIANAGSIAGVTRNDW